jgi:iron(III) transport system permease protein
VIAALQRTAGRHGGILAAVFAVITLLVLLPGLGFLTLLGGSTSSALALTPTQLNAIRETLILMSGVALVAGVIGAGTAWLVSVYDFPLRRAFEVLLLLPLAFPTYLAAFVAVDLLHFFGPVQSALRWLTGWKSARDYWFPEMRSMGGAILLLGLVLFPYVYVPCRIVFSRSGRNIIDAARLLGSSGADLFWRVGLPVALPALIGGLVLALLEALNDIGATEYLGVSSLSVLIRDFWANRGDMASATRMAAMLLAIVALLLILDPTQRRGRSGPPARAGRPAPSRIPLPSGKAWLAFACCAIPVLLGFAIPALFLAGEVMRHALLQGLDAGFFSAAFTSVMIATAVSLVVMAAGAFVAIAIRLMPGLGRLGVLTAIGYATPGTVLALAVLPVIRTADDVFAALGLGLSITATTGVVLYALASRFLGIGASQSAVALARLPRNVDSVARVHGMHDLELIFRVHFPVMLPGLTLAGLLVFIDTVKELPATLLLRPLNLETLATRTYSLASVGLFEKAALEALAIVALSGFAAWLFARQS